MKARAWRRPSRLLTVLLALGYALMGCAPQMVRLDRPAPGSNPAPVSYNLILYGARYLDDPGRMALLDIDGDGYAFRPRALADEFRIEKGLSADEAMQGAVDFLKDHCAYGGFAPRVISLASSGALLGYEITPVYHEALCPSADEVLVSYGPGGEGDVIYIYMNTMGANMGPMIIELPGGIGK